MLDREGVDEAGAISAVYKPGHFERLAVLVQAGVQDFEDGHAGWQVEGFGFVVAGHPGQDFILSGGEEVAAFFKSAVDAAGSGLGFQQCCAFGICPAEVGRDYLEGIVVGVVGVAPA